LHEHLCASHGLPSIPRRRAFFHCHGCRAAWSQDNVTTVDCAKSWNTAGCIDKPQNAAAAVPTKALTHPPGR
jgi:hypothetical protein